MGQPAPDHADDDQRRDQRKPEHGVAAVQQGRATGVRCHVRDEQRARGRRHHRRDHGHQPAAERRVGLDVDLGEHQERDARRGEQAARGARGPQDPVEVDGHAFADQVLADEHRSGPDGEERHRRRAVEVGHLRVARVAARHRRMSQPLDGDRRPPAPPGARRRTPTPPWRRCGGRARGSAESLLPWPRSRCPSPRRTSWVRNSEDAPVQPSRRARSCRSVCSGRSTESTKARRRRSWCDHAVLRAGARSVVRAEAFRT